MNDDKPADPAASPDEPTAREPEEGAAAASEEAPPVEPTPPSTPAANERATSPARLIDRVREWLWRGEALREADDTWAALPAHRRRQLVHAQESVLAARALLEATPPLPRGVSGAYPAWILVDSARQAVTDSALPADAAVVPEEAEPADAATPAERAAIPTPPEDEPTLAREAKEGLDEVAGRLAGPLAPVNRRRVLLRERGRRVLGSVLGSLVLLYTLGGVYGTAIRRPPLKATAKYSSSVGTCHPEHNECLGGQTAILFHTDDEGSPWAQYDLGAVRPIREVFVRNRTDFGPERAVPLVLELSDDGTSWRTVARREKVFETWSANVGPTQTRYVRLRVDRKSILHLEAVEIR